MAVENDDLVDSTFIIDYLSSIQTKVQVLDKSKTDAFAGLLRAKFEDESVRDYIIERYNSTEKLLAIMDRYDIKELEELLLEKWHKETNRNNVSFIDHFKLCQRVIKDKRAAGEWTDE